MPGSNVVKMASAKKASKPEIITLTPEMAMGLLEHNQHNRPLSDLHVQRIARQIIGGKWKFNGDTIKIAKGGDVLDGQHRLWAVIESKRPIQTIIVHGIERDAFSTIDTVRRMRSGGDVLALNGVERYRSKIAIALTWMLRWQRGVLETYRDATNKIENSDIEEAWRAHPGMADAMERATKLRRICNPNILAFIFYVTANKDEVLAERLMATLENPARASLNDPFFKLRSYLTEFSETRKDPVYTIALAIKALNAAHTGKKIERLKWTRQGRHREMFPKLNF